MNYTDPNASFNRFLRTPFYLCAAPKSHFKKEQKTTVTYLAATVADRLFQRKPAPPLREMTDLMPY